MAQTQHKPDAPPPALETVGALADCRPPALLVDGGGGVVGLSPAAVGMIEKTLAGGALDRIALAVADIGAMGDGTGSVLLPAVGDGPAERLLELTLLPAGVAEWRLVVLRDVTLDVSLRAALTESRQRYKDLVEASSDFAWETGPDGAFVFVSAGGALGYEAEDLIGRQPADFVIDAADAGPPPPFTAREPIKRHEFWFRDAAGEPACMSAAATPILDENGRWRGARGVCRDVTELRARDTALAAARNRERLMGYVLRTIGDAVSPAEMLAAAASATAHALSATGALICQAADNFAPVARFGELPETGRAPAGLSMRLAGAEGAVKIADQHGSWLAAQTRFGGKVNGAVCLWRPPSVDRWSADERDFLTDISGHVAAVIEQAAQHHELERLSNTDGLTGLDNRRAFFQAVERRLAGEGAAARQTDAAPGALVYLDLDNFKQVNDLAGHHRGDEVLKAVAGILRRSTRGGDRVARLGGDEFALWLEATDAAGAAAKAAALVEAAGGIAEFSPEGAPPLGFSVGVAVHDPAAGETLMGLVARADEAMYAVKRRGKGSFEIAPPPANAGHTVQPANAGQIVKSPEPGR